MKKTHRRLIDKNIMAICIFLLLICHAGKGSSQSVSDSLTASLNLQ